MSNNHLIIGLGGTGGKVIRELRKTIERNKNSDASNAANARFEYLYVDTSDDEIKKTEEWKVLGKEVDLARSQYLINTANGVRPVLNDPDSFPGLKEWIEPREIFDFVNATTAGAAQRRKLGRVVFAQNAPKFTNAFIDRLKVLEASGKEGATIHVICGLAGGTGSGSVLDAVAQMRHNQPDDSKYRILIYALLPDRNSTWVKNVAGFSPYYANGYAALAELNAMAVGKYKPIHILDGSRLAHDVYFNGCYLINNINENGIKFEVQDEIPKIISEFIFQKTMNPGWEGLNRAEKGENDIKNFESEDDGKARAKLFLSFGIKRVVVPEQEIKEYLAYGFAEQVTRQLMFNNFRQGEGYADEAVQKDWGSEARKPDVLQALLLTDAHLSLELGILEDDAKNSTWKLPLDYWKLIVSSQAPTIQADKSIAETAWIPTLNSKLGKVYNETYRTLGGVQKFYEVKGNARLEMAKHIRRTVEKEMFARWKGGQSSLIQLRALSDGLITVVDERLSVLLEKVSRIPTELQSINQRITSLSNEFNNVGFFGKHLTDKRGGQFAEISNMLQAQYTLSTQLQGYKFACGLIPFVKEQLIELRGLIDTLHQMLAAATEKINLERASRLGDSDAAYQKRMFDKTAINAVMKAINTDENAQSSRTQRVRKALIDLAGTDVTSFDHLSKSLSLGSIISTLSQESAQILELAHAEISQNLPPVLHVNIVERLQKTYDANPSGLKTFVTSIYDEAGAMLQFNATEVTRTVGKNEGGSQGRSQIIGVFLPDCENQKAFRSSLSDLFDAQKDPASDTKVSSGILPNQIVMIKIASLMPVRFVESLAELKRHYDGLLKDSQESFLLHGEGDGKKLPPLFARSAVEVKMLAKHKPFVIVAYLLGLVKERQNKTTGLNEWVLSYLAGGLPKVQVLAGENIYSTIQNDQPDELQAIIEREVTKRLTADYKHIDKKKELRSGYQALVLKRFTDSGDDDQDNIFLTFSSMQEHVLSIIGIDVEKD